MKNCDKSVRGLMIVGCIAGGLLILAGIGVFLSVAATPYLMALAVGCGMVVNAVLAFFSLLGHHKACCVVFLAIVLALAALFIRQLVLL